MHPIDCDEEDLDTNVDLTIGFNPQSYVLKADLTENGVESEYEELDHQDVYWATTGSLYHLKLPWEALPLLASVLPMMIVMMMTTGKTTMFHAIRTIQRMHNPCSTSSFMDLAT